MTVEKDFVSFFSAVVRPHLIIHQHHLVATAKEMPSEFAQYIGSVAGVAWGVALFPKESMKVLVPVSQLGLALYKFIEGAGFSCGHRR